MSVPEAENRRVPGVAMTCPPPTDVFRSFADPFLEETNLPIQAAAPH